MLATFCIQLVLSKYKKSHIVFSSKDLFVFERTEENRFAARSRFCDPKTRLIQGLFVYHLHGKLVSSRVGQMIRKLRGW